jgi:hypothetical protein
MISMVIPKAAYFLADLASHQGEGTLPALISLGSGKQQDVPSNMLNTANDKN